MEINGLTARVHLPDAPKGDGVHQLPPYCLQDVWKVDDYNCPTNWMHGSGNTSSYFFGIEPGKHMWLDFNGNWSHSHHVAIVMSIQGVCPINGMPTKFLRMEQYREKCPIHDHPFGADRFCQKCADKVPAKYQGFDIEHFPTKWAPQNYMTTVSHDPRKLWADGWYKDADEVLGFLITEETMRGVATHIVGEDRVFAIGIAFFLSKEPKPKPITLPVGDGTFTASASDEHYKTPYPHYKMSGICGQSVKSSKYITGVAPSSLNCEKSPSVSVLHSRSPFDEATLGNFTSDQSEVVGANIDIVEYDDSVMTKIEVGAGARIRQDLCKLDPSSLDFYQPKPAGVIYASYCLKSERDRILATGKIKERVGSFLDQIPTGNQ